MLRSRQLLGTCALIVLVLGLGLQSTVALNIIEKVARAFAHQQLSSVQPSHRLSLQPFAELEIGSTIARAQATVASKATAEVEDKVDLPSDDRSPPTPTPITTPAAEEELPSDSLDPDVALKLAQRSAPAPARTNSLQSLAREAAATAPAPAADEMRFREASTQRASATAQLHADMQEQTEARVGRARAGLLPSLGGIGKRAQNNVNKLMGKNVVHQAEIIEDCVACRYIWSQVEMDVANARYAEDVQASFEHNCLDAQKAPIFYNACEDMYDDMYAMTDDYMSQALTVDDMCMKAKMCQDPSKKSFSLFG